MTTPSNLPGDVRPKQISSYDYRYKVVGEWIQMGVPLRPAEVAGIDMGSAIHIAQQSKLTPKQTAKMLYNEVYNCYSDDNGKWHYQQVMPTDQEIEQQSSCSSTG